MTLDELCIKSAKGIDANPSWSIYRIAEQIKGTIIEWERIKSLPSDKTSSEKS